jgi:response regulator RpfG family c-di-GMP phosphodiesterase
MSTSKRIGKYEVMAMLGRGERSAVYRGEDSDTKKPVAIKLLKRADVRTELLPAFKKQSLSLSRLEHPSIAACIDVVENEGAFGVVSELAEGMAVSALLKDDAHPDLKNVWDIVKPMLEALAAAHSLGASHRDLKPANLMLSPAGALRITDFGVAALLSTPPEDVHYRAPEQFAGDGPLGPRTDVYQAGAIIYHLITGKVPFTGTPAEIQHRVYEERPTDPSSYNNRIAWQLDWVIQKAMSKDAAERFPTATEFAEGLRLGLQETIGRPLDAISTRVARPAPAAAPAAAKPTPAAAKPAPAAAKPAPAATKPEPAAAKPATAPKPAPTGDKFELALEPIEPLAELDEAPTPAKPTPAGVVPAKAGTQSPAPAAPAPAAHAPAAPAPASAPVVPKPAPKARVLFVDDEERILTALKAVFRNEYDVVTATSAEAALEVVNAGGVHVVVSDQRMPGLTGVELLRKVRAAAPAAMRLLLTGYADLASLVGSINEGEIFRFVKKPWENDELRKDVSDAVKIALESSAAAADAAVGPVPGVSPRVAGALLVIDPKEGMAKGLERLLADETKVIQVTSPAEAAKVLATTEVATIVADLGAGLDGLVALFKQVRAKRPRVLTILLADEPDSELGIELINKAQIFRFLPKPVSAKDLRHQVAEALRRYALSKDSAPAAEGARGGGANPASSIARSA